MTTKISDKSIDINAIKETAVPFIANRRVALTDYKRIVGRTEWTDNMGKWLLVEALASGTNIAASNRSLKDGYGGSVWELQ